MMCHRAPAILALVVLCSALAPLARAQEQDDGPRAADLARAIELATMRSLHALARARRVENARAVRCLDPRVSELNAVFRQATERTERVRRAERAGDDETVARESAIVVRLHARARTLERYALECIGQEREVEPDWIETDVQRVRDDDSASDAQRGRVARRRRPR